MTDEFFDKSHRTRANAWFLTIDTPDPGSIELAKHRAEKYAVWQVEAGDSGTPHLRATLVFKKVVYFNQIKRLYPGARKTNIRKVTNLANAIEYCRKEKGRLEGPWERGEAPKSKLARTDGAAASDTPLVSSADKN
jgi:hypothetical protein